MEAAGRGVGVVVALLATAGGWVAASVRAEGLRGGPLRFYFGPGSAPAGWIAVSPNARFEPDKAFGWEGDSRPSLVDRGGMDPLRHGFVTAGSPILFTTPLAEGNYRVTVTHGDPQGVSNTTVKAQSRRLMLEHVTTRMGEVVNQSFVVSIRHPRVGPDGVVRLKPDERAGRSWQEALTLEFSGPRPAVEGVEITPASEVPTVFIAGDSTVCDQTHEPWCGWGQMLPAFFGPNVAVSNHAESGESLKSFGSELRSSKLLAQLRAGDYLLLQFGHNDQKDRSPGAGAFTTYADRLRNWIRAARERNATPILVTPMHRRRFDENGKVTNSLGDYPEAVRRLAVEEKVPLIDLNRMSAAFYEALGPEKSKRAFVHYPAGTYPGQTAELKDNTHFNAYGAYELARCVAEGLRQSGLPLARLLRPEVKPFDPAHPDPVEAFHVPASAGGAAEKPEGS